MQADSEKELESCPLDEPVRPELVPLPADATREMWSERLEALSRSLEREMNERRRAQCMAHIQNDAVQLALDLLVREPDVKGFFRAFTKTLIDLGESDGCAVFLLDESASQCELWMTHIGQDFFTKESAGWNTIALPRESMASHLFAFQPGWTETVEYSGDDERLPESVREFNRGIGTTSILVTPLVLPNRNLGWISVASRPESQGEAMWRKALLEAVARQATLALHHNQIAEQNQLEARRQAVLEERNRIARDIHDTLAQGFAAILMQLQSVHRSIAQLPPAVARSIETAVDLARTHMIEARRSVSSLRPQDSNSGDVVAMLQRMTEFARRTTHIPIDLTIEDELPEFGSGADRDIVAIAQEALTNAVHHARATRIKVDASSIRSVGFRLSVSDDGRGIAKERMGTGFGLTSMQERADRIGASLTIVTAPRSGTEVVLAWEPASFTIPRREHDHAAH